MQPPGPGTVLDARFRLEDLLSDTSGAQFWRATDRVLARSVAVHLLHASDPRSSALLQAARTSATVPDPHFLRVLDAAEEDGIAYVVSEWGSGSSLDLMLAEGPLTPRRAAWLVKQVAEAITTAHAQGIAHGRLLPENVMVTDAGSVKLIGFVVDAVLNGRHRHSSTGEPLSDHESDVLNLGALLYCTLVGRWPGSEGSALVNAPRERGRPLRPRQVRAGVPPALDAICERVLNADMLPPGHRLESAHDICCALGDFLGDPAGPAPVDVEPTMALALDDAPYPADPEATQAGVPLLDTDSGSRGPAQPWGRQVMADGAAPHHEAVAARAPEITPPVAAELPPPVAAGASPVPPASRDHSSQSRRPWRTLVALLLAAALVVLGVVIADAFRGEGGSPGAGPGAGPDASPGASAPSSASGARVRIAAVRDFDPQGDPPEENPTLVDRAVDGDPTTAWTTLTYFRNPRLGLLKDGVGLLVELPRVTTVSRVRLTLLGSPTSLELLAARPGAAAPADEVGLRTVGSATDAGPTVDISLEQPVRTRYLVVWLTSLPAVGDGYQGRVAEISLRS